MTAAMICLERLPFARSRSANALSMGFQRIVVIAGMYKTRRTWTLPTLESHDAATDVPERYSRGHKPTKAASALALRNSVSCGNSPRNVAATRSPMPGPSSRLCSCTRISSSATRRRPRRCNRGWERLGGSQGRGFIALQLTCDQRRVGLIRLGSREFALTERLDGQRVDDAHNMPALVQERRQLFAPTTI
jgi:hypothetical protein